MPEGTLAVVSALPAELNGVVARSHEDDSTPRHRDVRFRRLGEQRLALVTVGVGPRRAGASLEVLRALHEEISLAGLWVLGLGGGLDPTLERGQVVFGERTVLGVEDAPCDSVGLSAPPAFLDAANRVDAVKGVVVTVDEMLLEPEAKADLWHDCDRPLAAVVDMESYVLARFADRLGLPWAVFRVVSDTAEDRLPPFLRSCQSEDGGLDPGVVARKAALRPWTWRAMISMGRELRRGSDRLGATLQAALGAA